MRIVIDARLSEESGLGRYIRNLIDNLSLVDHENVYILLVGKKFNLKLSRNFHTQIVEIPWYSLREQIILPKILDNLQADIVHFPHFNVPIFYKGKFIVTIHDLIHQHFNTRETSTRNVILYKIKKLCYGRVFSDAINKSSAIITPSKHIKNQLISEWNVDNRKIVITYEGVDNNLINLENTLRKDQFCSIENKFGFNKPYFFYIGNAQPHKNINTLISAFEEFNKNNPSYYLVLSGPENFFWKKIMKKVKSAKIVYTKLVTDLEMINLYKNAQAFVTPSLEEGFGLPVLESMYFGCPVIASDIETFKEIANDAILYFNPHNINNLVEQMEKIDRDSLFRISLINKGKTQVKKYNFKDMAEKTLRVYNSLK